MLDKHMKPILGILAVLFVLSLGANVYLVSLSQPTHGVAFLQDAQHYGTFNVRVNMWKGGQTIVDPSVAAIGWRALNGNEAPQGIWYYSSDQLPTYTFRQIDEVGGRSADSELLANGYVVLSQAPIGIWYTYSIHNVLTNCWANFIQKQASGTAGIATNGANYIALTNNGTTNGQNDCTLQGEVTAANGLQRAIGAVAYNVTGPATGDVSWTISKTFTASADVTVQKAGLAIVAYSTGCALAIGQVSPIGQCFVAATTFLSASLQGVTSDTLAIVWTIAETS